MTEPAAACGCIESDAAREGVRRGDVPMQEQERDDAALPRSRDLAWATMHVRAVRESSREADFVFSTDALARDGARIDQRSWRLDSFLRNPVVLYSHGRAPDSLPIGKVKGLSVDGGELAGTIVYASERANPLAERVWQGVLEETIRATSVGFRPGRVEFIRDEGEEYALLSDCELFEVSNTPIGSDPLALRRMVERAHNNINPPPQERGGDNPNHTNEESDVDELKEVRAALDDKTRELADVCQERDAERAKVAELTERCATLEAERNERQAQINELRADGVRRDLEELVGKKIAPTEVDGLCKLAALDRGLYEAQLAAINGRPDMNIVRDEPVVNADAKQPVTNSAESAGAVDLFAEAASRAAKEV